MPDADVPVVQLSIDEAQAPDFRHDLGKHLAPLRDEGALIPGSGNVVHNLHAYARGRHPAQPFDWAVRFETAVRSLILQRDFEPLVDYASLGPDAELSIPTPEPYLPLRYVPGASGKDDTVRLPTDRTDGGSISMLSVQSG